VNETRRPGIMVALSTAVPRCCSVVRVLPLRKIVSKVPLRGFQSGSTRSAPRMVVWPVGKSTVERVRTSIDSPDCTISNVSRPARRPPTVMANVPESTVFSTNLAGLSPPHARIAGAATASTTETMLR
jgi:hypothetical protein